MAPDDDGILRPDRRRALLGGLGAAVAGLFNLGFAGGEQHLLSAAVPGIRNYPEYGGVGLLVFDMDHGHRCIKRIPTMDSTSGKSAEAIKGICASARTGKLYLITPTRLVCMDLRTEKTEWIRTPEGENAYPSTGEVFEAKNRTLVATLTDETGRPVHSEKMVEVVLRDGQAVRTGDQFGLGRKTR
jgi:hypothetical protein